MAASTGETYDRPLFTTTATKSGKCTLRDGNFLSYEVHGTGKNRIALIMGLFASRYSWRETLNYYTSQPGDEYSVLVYDNRGAGVSSAPWGRYTTKMMAADALELFNHLGWTEERSVHVNGLSMGGMIALELASLAGTRLKSLTLTVTCAKHQNPPRTRAESAQNWVNFFRPKVSYKAKVDNMIESLFSDTKWLAEEKSDGSTNRDAVFAMLMNRVQKSPGPPMSGQVGQIAAVLTHNCSYASLAKIGETVPDILIITGDADKLVSPKCSEEMYTEISDRGARKDVRKVILPGKGHALPVEAEEEYHREIHAILEAGNRRWQK